MEPITAMAHHPAQNGMVMQPQYIQDVSKTSRTLGMQEETVNVRRAQGGGSNNQGSTHNNSVIRRPPRIHRRNRGRRIPYFQKKKRTAQRRIIQKPWSRPMAAQHLAAIKIQGAIRKFLFKNRKE